ncbi:glycosyltransferase family 2 protein [Aerococcus viridans]
MGSTFKGEQIVSTIITTFKRSDSLRNAIYSVLDQTYKNIEVIVVDDNNNDNYRENVKRIMSEFSADQRVHYIQHKKNMNGAVARNTGIKVATGDFITFLDDDDTFHKKRFELLIPELAASNRSCGLIFSGFSYVRSKKEYKIKKVTIPKNVTTELLKTRFDIGSGSNFIMKREVLNCLQGFDSKFLRHQDLEFLVRVSEKFNFISVDANLLNIELEDSHQNKLDIDRLIKTKKQYIDKFHYLITPQNSKSIINSHLEDIVYQIFLNGQEKEYAYVLKKYIEMNKTSYVMKISYLYLKALLKKYIM